MTLSITHAFSSGYTDGTDSSKLQPSNWNAAHVLTGVVSLAQGGTGPFGADGTILVGGTTPAWSATPTLTGLILGTGANLSSPGDGRLLLTNNAISKRVMFETTTDAKLRLLNFDGSLFSTLECGTLTTFGVATFSDVAIFSSILSMASLSLLNWSGKSELSSPINGQLNLTVQGAGTGIGFDVSTDSVLKVRTRAQTGDASVSASNHLASGYYEGTEMVAPSAGAVNTGRLYFEDNGSGKTRLMCLFNTGSAQQIAIQP